MKYNETPEFLALQDEWYAKLEAEGFRDIEPRQPGTCEAGLNLKGMSCGDLARGLYQEDREDYYRWARQYAHEMPAGPARHIWRLHADGLGETVIYRALGERYGVSQGYVGRSIKETRAAMMAHHSQQFEEEEGEYTVQSLIAEAVRPAWFTVPARGSVAGSGLARRPKVRAKRRKS